MKVSLTLAGGLVVTLAVAFTVVKYLTTPLRQQLQELCGNAKHCPPLRTTSDGTIASVSGTLNRSVVFWR